MTGADRALATVKALLDHQREALLTGDLVWLAQMPDRLARAMQTLADHAPPPSGLAVLADIASQNARLILAAQRGIAETRARSSGRGATPLTTYDARGRQWPTPCDGKVLSRR
jgi:hypothetical protein